MAQCDSQELSEEPIRERLRHGMRYLPEEMKVPASMGGDCTADRAVAPDASNPLEDIFGHFPTLGELTRYAIDMAMKKANNNQSHAARSLGISKQAMSKRLIKKR